MRREKERVCVSVPSLNSSSKQSSAEECDDML